MAKPPSKRRGISLDPRADTAAPLDLMTFQSAAFPAAAPALGSPSARPAGMPELVAELRRMSDDLDTRWKAQEEQLQQQREQIGLQTRQLQSLEKSRRSAARLGSLLAIVALVGIAALGFQGWLRFQDLASNTSRMNASLGQVTMELQALQGRLTDLDSGMGQMDSTIAALREEVSQVHSELGSLGTTVDRMPTNQGAERANRSGTRQVAHTPRREASPIPDPFRRMHPMRPW